MIVGFRNIGLAILMDELQNASKNLIVMTDDGSNGKKGFVTDALREQLEAGARYEHVVAIGPMPMMRAVCEMTRPYGIHTVVSMNPIMIDGTGMCGGCRLTVGGETKFACVDGPEFRRPSGRFRRGHEALAHVLRPRKKQARSATSAA